MLLPLLCGPALALLTAVGVDKAVVLGTFERAVHLDKEQERSATPPASRQGVHLHARVEVLRNGVL